MTAGTINPRCFPAWSSIRHISICLYSYPTALLDTLHKLPRLESLRLYGEGLLAAESTDELLSELEYPERSFKLCRLKALVNSTSHFIHHLLAPHLKLIELFNTSFQPR